MRLVSRPPAITRAAAATTDLQHWLARAAVGLATLVLLAAPPRLAAQGVLLELRPRVGDTLRLRLDQDMEVVATRRLGSVDSTVTMRRHVTVLSHSIVQKVDDGGATILAITDSVLVDEGRGTHTRRGLAGKRIVLHVAPDGSTRVMDDGGMLTPEASALVSQLPATLPRHAIAVGATWAHTTDVPMPGQPDGASAGALHATFRLDSLSRYGDVAYLSMRGTLDRPASAALPPDLRLESSGNVTGTIAIDRRRGWLTGLHATITTTSVLTPPGRDAAPVRMRTRITQWLRAVDKP